MQLARIELEFLIQRAKSSLIPAKAKGKVLGRPQGTTIDQQDFLKKYKNISADLQNGLSVRKADKNP